MFHLCLKDKQNDNQNWEMTHSTEPLQSNPRDTIQSLHLCLLLWVSTEDATQGEWGWNQEGTMGLGSSRRCPFAPSSNHHGTAFYLQAKGKVLQRNNQDIVGWSHPLQRQPHLSLNYLRCTTIFKNHLFY